MPLTLTQDQQKAADDFLGFMLDDSQSEMIIDGFAGTGKSTLTRHILDQIPAQKKLYDLLLGGPREELEIHVTATTNKAAQVIAQLTGTEPRTIHSLIGLKVTNDYRTGVTRLEPGNNYRVLEHSLVIIDEASFIDSNLLAWIRKSTRKCKVLYIGDPYQLAPVFEATSPVFNLDIPRASLNQVMRNGGAIAALSDQYRLSVKDGIFQPPQLNQDSVLHVDGPTFQQMIDSAFSDADDAKIIAWTNERVQQYNDYVRGLRGFTGALQPGERVVANTPIKGKTTFYPADTHYRITDASPAIEDGIQGQKLQLDGKERIFVPDDWFQVKQYLKQLAKHKSWSTYFNIKETWGDLRPLHACTGHKSQGSTYDRVFIDLADMGRCTRPSDMARLLYVAVSRARHQVILYGNLPARYGGPE